MTGCTISLTDARTNLSDTISRVQYGNERVVICRHDKPAAAVVSIEDKELLDRLEELVDLRVAMEALREVEREGAISLADLRRELGV